MFFVNSVNTFSTWLLSMLGDKGWSQAELARRAGVTPTAISDVLSGRRNVGNDLAVSIANALKVPADSVLLNEEVADIISTFKPD